MAIIHNGAEVSDTKDILLDIWKDGIVDGTEDVERPSLCLFNNTAKAIEMLNKHIERNSTMCFHTDVDVDGIGTTYIFKKALERLGSHNHLLLINRDKEHGIFEKHVGYFKNNPIDLLIITDSSSNEINTIKQFNCDVLCIDHHDLLHNDLSGTCSDGIHNYVIVNNTIDNPDFNGDKLWLSRKNSSAFQNLTEYIGTKDMSCGLVVYELMRVYCECFSNPDLLENLMLYQWVGVTLLTDVINTLNRRNQWYMNKTLFNQDTEQSLSIMMHYINKYKAKLDKSYIQYSFAPLINKAIRAGKSGEALDVVINHPEQVEKLKVYAAIQKEIVEKATNVVEVNPVTGLKVLRPKIFTSKTITIDLDKLGVHRNYSGVIASRLCGDNKKNCAAYVTLEDGTLKGSFRGRFKNIDYRKYFADYDESIYAQGHPGAFGIRLKKEQLDTIMDSVDSIEPKEETKPFITIGNIPENEYGVYHVTDLNEFKKLGYIWKLATGNAKVTSPDEIYIRVRASDVRLKKTEGSVYFYDVLGMECKAFSPLKGSHFDLYVEFTNEINMYLR